jgi:glycosyltransferase involved in cell wall biosynthesis
LRLALVHPFCWPEVRRGGERYLADLAWYLGQAGHLVDVITGTTGPADVKTDGNVTIRRSHHGSGPSSFGVVAAAVLARRRYDVVQALTPSTAIAARLTGHRTVFSTLGHPGDVFGVGEHALFAGAVRVAHVTTAPSRSAATRVSWFSGRPAAVLPPGVRLDRLTPRVQPPQGPPTILFPSDAAEERKGLGHAVAALDRLLDWRPDARLLIAGAAGERWAGSRLGEYGARVAAAVDVLPEAEPDDMPDRYRAASITVLPSWSEAFGLVLVESLACGTPVVCTDEGGMPEIVTDDAVGRVAGRAGDVDGLAAALRETLELAADSSTPARCAAHARQWGWAEEIGPRHAELYRSLVVPSR